MDQADYNYLNLSFSMTDSIYLAVFVCASVVYSIYWFIYEARAKVYANQPVLGFTDKDNYTIFTKFVGFIILGMVPLVLFYILFSGQKGMLLTGLYLHGYQLSATLIWVGIFSALVLPLSWIMAKSKNSKEQYPEVRNFPLSRKKFGLYLVSWMFYLLGYEFLFRGILFLFLAHTMGVAVALPINVALYTFAHIPKGAGETIGSFILGFVFCVAAIETGSIWAPFLMHLVMALSGNVFPVLRNSEMHIGRA